MSVLDRLDHPHRLAVDEQTFGAYRSALEELRSLVSQEERKVLAHLEKLSQQLSVSEPVGSVLEGLSPHGWEKSAQEESGSGGSFSIGRWLFGTPLEHLPESAPMSDSVSASAWSNLAKILAAGAGIGALYAILRSAYRRAFLDQLFTSTDKYRYHLKDVRSIHTPVLRSAETEEASGPPYTSSPVSSSLAKKKKRRFVSW